MSLKDLKFYSVESLFRLNLILFNKSLISVTEQRLMKIDPTKMIENEIQWLLNFECGTNLGKVMAYNILKDFLCHLGAAFIRVQSVWSTLKCTF